jgi:chemotaxis protein MotB
VRRAAHQYTTRTSGHAFGRPVAPRVFTDFHREDFSMRYASMPIAATLLMSASLFPGCVQQDRYDQLVMANRSLEEQIVSLEDEVNAERNSMREIQGQLSESRSAYGNLESQYSDLNTSIDQFDAQNSEYLRRIAELELGPLPEDIEAAITDLVMQHPEMLTFDPRLGMLRFSSDLTFDLGSTELTPDAIATIETLASILTASNALDLEVRVVGHTDNVPIRRAETKRNHPTNVHLSVHRAIAVRDVIVRSGVAADRLLVAGYGETQPIVANGPRGAVENRRVEIFLAPMRRSSVGTATAASDIEPAPMPTEPSATTEVIEVIEVDEVEPLK